MLAPPRGLSQRATSFFASQRQGIHRMLLSRLIDLLTFMHGEDCAADPQQNWEVHAAHGFAER